MGTYSPPIDGRRKFEGCLLDFNECTVPQSKKVSQALREMINAKQLQVYPEYGDLAGRIAAYARVAPEEVMITNGSAQGIELIFRTFTEKGDAVVIPSPSFAMFDQCAGVAGNAVLRPLYRASDLSFPVEEVLEILEGRQKIKLIVICNPNNPTGTLVQVKDVRKILVKAAEKGTMVYVDEAYSEFSGVSVAPLVREFPNLVITRTFSKAFGLAALRIGYVISCRENLAEIKKVRGPYDVNMMACTGARVALEDSDSMQKYADEVMKKAKPMVEDFFRKNAVPFYKSAANFILFNPTNPEEVFKKLKDNGILVRPRKGQQIDGALRVSIGTVSQMKKFIEAYPKKYAFLDRDGALIYEPQNTFQVDRLDQLKILPGAIVGLKKLIEAGYALAMVTNQEGLGTRKYPRKNFTVVQGRLLSVLKKNGVTFEAVYICPHFPDANCSCRKPKTGLVDKLFRTRSIDQKKSFMYGDRETDAVFAKNMGIRFIKAPTNDAFIIPKSFSL